MKVTLVIGLAMLWILGTVISLTLENSYIGQESQYDSNGVAVGSVSTLTMLMTPEFTEMTNPVSFVTGIFNLLWNYVKAFWNMFWWNYAMFTGVWSVFKYIGWCISLGGVTSIVMALRGVPSF